jgi:hypothetical protein
MPFYKTYTSKTTTTIKCGPPFLVCERLSEKARKGGELGEGVHELIIGMTANSSHFIRIN